LLVVFVFHYGVFIFVFPDYIEMEPQYYSFFIWQIFCGGKEREFNVRVIVSLRE